MQDDFEFVRHGGISTLPLVDGDGIGERIVAPTGRVEGGVFREISGIIHDFLRRINELASESLLFSLRRLAFYANPACRFSINSMIQIRLKVVNEDTGDVVVDVSYRNRLIDPQKLQQHEGMESGKFVSVGY
jgi:hypothetical protein